jgi:hypothetical protein
MKFGRGRLLRPTCWLLAMVGIALATGSGAAQRFEYVITFDNVVVQGIEGTEDTPAVAHQELLGGERSLPSAEPGVDRAEPGEGWNSLAAPLPFAPGPGTANPSFVQEGFLVEAFWAVKTGTRDAFFKRAHFHPADLSTGFEAQHLGNPTELHGIYIRSLDGKRFGLKSLRYRVTRNRQLPNKPFSIEGFSTFNVNVLVARSFDPRGSIRVQFVSFPVGLPAGNDPKLPWWTLRISGFELVDRVYIASSASVDFDDIVLTRSEPPPAPPERQEEK